MHIERKQNRKKGEGGKKKEKDNISIAHSIKISFHLRLYLLVFVCQYLTTTVWLSNSLGFFFNLSS